MRRFLSFVVEKAIAGEGDHLKETVIGVEVFDREPGYDPKVDPVVRNEARRLRAKVEEYYRLEQAPRAVRIGLPKGSYVPTFEMVAPPAPPADPIAAPKVDRPARGIRISYIAAGLAVVAAAVAAGYLSRIAPTFMTAPKSRAFTSFPGDEDQPKFSPDGESIAFVWDGPDGKSQNIYVQKTNAETPRRLTDHTAEDMSPVWSPDATQVAFLRVLDKLQYGIFTVPVGGGPERKWGEVTGVVAGAGAEPHMDWSPDGRFFAVAEKVSLERPRCIVLISAADGHRRQLTWPDQSSPGDSYPEFSPDARSVAFRRGVAVSVEDIWVVPVAGGEARRVTHDNRGTEGHAWTADGRSLVVASRRDSSFPSLWRFALSGGAPVRLTDSTYAGHPAISRHGNRLSYVNSVNDVNIWRVSVDGGEAVLLIASTMRDTSPQYSPDGSRIAFRSDRNGYDEIWACDRDGHDAMRITNFHGPLTGSPRWSPDSQELAFDTRPQGHADIYTVRADGGRPRRLTQDSSKPRSAKLVRRRQVGLLCVEPNGPLAGLAAASGGRKRGAGNEGRWFRAVRIGRRKVRILRQGSRRSRHLADARSGRYGGGGADHSAGGDVGKLGADGGRHLLPGLHVARDHSLLRSSDGTDPAYRSNASKAFSGRLGPGGFTGWALAAVFAIGFAG
jgi:Tol biopolymer transport system component